MTFLILTVVLSTINHLLFKAFARFRIDLLSAIAVNYAVCILIGYGSSSEKVFQGSIFARDWYPFSILQGIIFVGCLFLLGRTTAKHGVTAATIATRLSVAIPTAAAFFLYNDLVTALKILGILAALYALYLSCVAPSGFASSVKSISRLPFVLFLVFGAHATLLKFVQQRFLGATSYHVYIMFAFLSAFILSGAVLAWRLAKKKQKFRWKELVWGLVLGCSNYGAIYFLIRVLGVPGWESSQLFPTISISVVALSAFAAWVFFKERPCWRMLGALVIGAGAIVLVNIS